MKHSHFPLILIIFGLFWMCAALILLFVNQWQYARYDLRGETIRELAKDLAGREFYVHRANERLTVKRVEYLEYIENALQVNDKTFYQILNAVYFSFNQHGLKKWLDNPSLILALIGIESAYNPLATTFRILKDKNTGMSILDSEGNSIKVPLAQGIMQVYTDIWTDELKIDRSKIYDIDYNIDLGIQILKIYLEKHGGNISTALQDYVGDRMHLEYPIAVVNSLYFNGVKP